MPADGMSGDFEASFEPPAAGRLERFAAAVLAEAGALVEPVAPGTLEILSPPEVQAALKIAEISRLGFGARIAPGVVGVGLEADWLDRFGRLIGPRGQVARWVLNPPARAPSDPVGLLAKTLAFDNATFRLQEAQPAWTRLLIFEFRYTATADEKCEGLIRIGLNLATGALINDPPMPEVAGDADLPPAFSDDASGSRDRVLAILAAALAARLDHELVPFLASLTRRLARDQDRLHGFHNDLHREAARRLSALPEGDPARRREEARVAAIGHEYQARTEDLSRQYALRVAVAWMQTLEIVLPVHRLTVELRRRKATRMLILDWNPLTRRIDSPSCEWCPGSASPRLVCDAALHLLSPAAMAPCGACGRPFCRACHAAACPKCAAPAAPPPALLLARASGLQ